MKLDPRRHIFTKVTLELTIIEVLIKQRPREMGVPYRNQEIFQRNETLMFL